LADARAAKSDAALRQAMLALLEARPFDQITVREIAASAGIHYATFFRHHPSKEALLDHIAAEQIERLVELTLPVLDQVDSRAAFLALFTYVDEHRALWTALLTGGAGATMRTELLRISQRVAIERAPEDSWLPSDLAVIATVSVIVETLAWWLAQPEGARPIAEMAEILRRLVNLAGMDDQPG
jgi:AcrR family transcriptional regulator